MAIGPMCRFLDLHLSISDDTISSKIYYKRDYLILKLSVSYS